MSYYFRCPQCQSDRNFAAINEHDSGLGCLLFFLGGFLPWLLYADSTRNRVQCTDCGHIFRQPPLPQSPLSNYAIAIIILVILSIGALLLMVAVPEFTSWLPNHPAVESFVELVEKHPEAVVGSVLPLLIILVVSGTVVSIVSNRRYRRQLRERVELEPKSYYATRKESTNDSPTSAP